MLWASFSTSCESQPLIFVHSTNNLVLETINRRKLIPVMVFVPFFADSSIVWSCSDLQIISLCRRGPTWSWPSSTRSSSCQTPPSWRSSRRSTPASASSPATWRTRGSGRRCASGSAGSADCMTSSHDIMVGESGSPGANCGWGKDLYWGR